MPQACKFSNRSPKHCKGITFIEIILVVAVGMILASLAIPSVSMTVAQAELESAQKNLEFSLRLARTAARRADRPVSVEFERNAQGDPIYIRYVSEDQNSLVLRELSEYRAPIAEAVNYVSGSNAFHYNHRGIVDNPGEIILIAKGDQSVSAVVAVN